MAHRVLSVTRKGGATSWATVQNASGAWTRSREETAEALIRKYFPEDDEKTDTAGNRETRKAQLECNENRDKELQIIIQGSTVSKCGTPTS